MSDLIIMFQADFTFLYVIYIKFYHPLFLVSDYIKASIYHNWVKIGNTGCYLHKIFYYLKCEHFDFSIKGRELEVDLSILNNKNECEVSRQYSLSQLS